MVPGRSYLFVPAKKYRLIEKAASSDADCVIIDLEDAVALSEKENARELVKEGLSAFGSRKEMYVRINDVTTSFWKEDLSCALRYGASGVIVPKAESKEGIRLVTAAIRDLGKEQPPAPGFKVIPLIESARGVQFVYDIASADSIVSNLAFGYIDFSLDIDCELTPGGLELLHARSSIVIASKAAGIGAPIDAVYPHLDNSEGLENEAKHARQLGFRGKLIIHPKQIEPVHHVFTPSSDEIEKAKKIVEKFEEAENEGVASISVDNELVDYPVYKKAKALLSFV